MSLKSPTEVLKEVFFFFVLLLVVVPLVQWGFISLALVAILLGHRVVAFLLFATGLIGMGISKNLRI